MNGTPESILDHVAPLNIDPALGAVHLATLTVFDRCDAPDCTAQAYVRAQLRSGLQLVFCGHHGHDLTPALAGQGAVIRDDSHRLRDTRFGSTDTGGRLV